MARVRTVKPEFWTDRRVGECSTSARLLFLATWNFADDEGGLDRSAKQLKAQAFPYDNLDCEPLVQELLSVGLLLEYEVEGEKYLHIKNFRKHQRIDRPQPARIPLYDPSKSVPRTFVESSSNVQRSKGREGNVREVRELDRRTACAVAFDEIRKVYPKRSGGQRWGDAQKHYAKRLKEGYTHDVILAGVRRYATWVTESGKERTEHVLQAATFLGDNLSFLEPYEPPKKPESDYDRMMRVNSPHRDQDVIPHEDTRHKLALL